MRRHIRILGLAIATALTAVLLLSGPAQAHISYVSSTPKAGAVLAKAPKSVGVVLSGPVRSGTVKVVNAKGVKVSKGTGARDPRNVKRIGVDLVAGLKSGRYTVTAAWVAADGHKQSRTFTFTVKKK